MPDGAIVMIVVGAVGRKGSGKDTVLDHLAQRCGLPTVEVGDIAREIADERGVEPTREHLLAISREFMSRHGKGYFMRRTVERIRDRGWDAAGVSGIRSRADVEVLREAFEDDFLLVAVVVGDARLRFKRTQQRGDPRDAETWEEFVKEDQEAERMFGLSEAIEEADVTVRNDGSLDALYEQVDEQIIEDRLSREIPCD
jgi:dephospho-CoA kinase